LSQLHRPACRYGLDYWFCLDIDDNARRIDWVPFARDSFAKRPPRIGFAFFEGTPNVESSSFFFNGETPDHRRDCSGNKVEALLFAIETPGTSNVGHFLEVMMRLVG